ncbi:MAG: hypothetical protein AB7O62_02485 [Pirellulales bacterium]
MMGRLYLRVLLLIFGIASAICALLAYVFSDSLATAGTVFIVAFLTLLTSITLEDGHDFDDD